MPPASTEPDQDKHEHGVGEDIKNVSGRLLADVKMSFDELAQSAVKTLATGTG